ncbi:MAG: EscU/YscU/HrcU family type III secretion system export apparatus switch protein [Gemmatales bacterium]|nr:EscU/YscU/HrcU family type III secretion system export apparatus switch protein [Gemmatales bacterium]MDW8174051.1 EscU/YscU/HrcU family type III secretion system export apparatus switch protein [Gemmatales bacterium]
MADEWLDSRTEPATERRRQRAREQGQVAVSPELTAAILFLTALLALVYGAGQVGMGLMRLLGQTISYAPPQFDRAESWTQVCGATAWEMFSWVAMFLTLTAIGGLAAHFAQSGLLFVPGAVRLDVERILPATGLARMFSWSACWRTLLACGKVVLLAAIGWWVLSGRTEQIASWTDIPLSLALGEIWSLGLRLALYAGLCFLMLGLADYAWQRWRYERQLMMTRWELREELRQDEGDPQMRARLRKLMREMSQRRTLRDVSSATVVLRNPTHLAVALRYERQTMSAPKVVAKGAGTLAERILDIARQHFIPILERPPLAQALFRLVPVGQEIPPALYLAVAEVLAFVYRQRGWSAAEQQG